MATIDCVDRDWFLHVYFDERHPNCVLLHRGAEIDPATKLSRVPNITDEENMASCSFGSVAINAFETVKWRFSVDDGLLFEIQPGCFEAY